MKCPECGDQRKKKTRKRFQSRSSPITPCTAVTTVVYQVLSGVKNFTRLTWKVVKIPTQLNGVQLIQDFSSVACRWILLTVTSMTTGMKWFDGAQREAVGSFAGLEKADSNQVAIRRR